MTCPVTLTLPATSFCGLAIFIVRAVFSIIISPSKSICGSTNNTRIIDINVPRPSATPIEATVASEAISPIRKPAQVRIEPDVNIVGNDADIQGTFQGQMKVSVDSLIPGRQGQVTYEDTDNLLLTDKSDGVDNTENVTNNTEKGDEQ